MKILLVTDLYNREPVLMKPVAVINLEVKDNHEEAAIGGRLTLELCQEVCAIFLPLCNLSLSFDPRGYIFFSVWGCRWEGNSK